MQLAFRAGNYGANDDTLRALARLGIAFSFGLVAVGLLASLGLILTFQRKGHGT